MEAMTKTNASNGQGFGGKGINDLFRRQFRQFLKLTGTAILACMKLGVGGIARMANAAGFSDVTFSKLPFMDSV